MNLGRGEILQELIEPSRFPPNPGANKRREADLAIVRVELIEMGPERLTIYRYLTNPPMM